MKVIKLKEGEKITVKHFCMNTLRKLDEHSFDTQRKAYKKTLNIYEEGGFPLVVVQIESPRRTKEMKDWLQQINQLCEKKYNKLRFDIRLKEVSK